MGNVEKGIVYEEVLGKMQWKTLSKRWADGRKQSKGSLLMQKGTYLAERGHIHHLHS